MCSAQNWRYCWMIQESLIFNKDVAEKTLSRIRDPSGQVSDSYKGLQIWNQHVIDTGLIQMVEKDRDDALSMGQSQVVGIDDVKSIKSKHSLRSEMPALASEEDDQASRIGAAQSQGGRRLRNPGRRLKPLMKTGRISERGKLSIAIEGNQDAGLTGLPGTSKGQRFLAVERNDSGSEDDYDEEEEEDQSDREAANDFTEDLRSHKSMKSQKVQSFKAPKRGKQVLEIDMKEKRPNDHLPGEVNQSIEMARPLSKRSMMQQANPMEPSENRLGTMQL